MSAFEDIDWETWSPTTRATLLFVIDGPRGLFIRKKRGLGMGKINAPGGHIEKGETPLQAAERELMEEVGVKAIGTRERGELFFQFTDGLRLHCHVFEAREHTGDPVETDEARPMWLALDALPYEEMWADDRVWLPQMLEGQSFVFHGLFDGDTMLGHTIRLG